MLLMFLNHVDKAHRIFYVRLRELVTIKGGIWLTLEWVSRPTQLMVGVECRIIGSSYNFGHLDNFFLGIILLVPVTPIV